MEARVLIVEDEALIALHLEQIVAEAGHRVTGIAFDPEDAKLLARKEHPDFAFVDLRLRNGTSGLEVARHLREEYDIPAIIISGNLDTQVREVLAELRPIALVGKPFMPSAIIAALALAVSSAVL